MSNPGKIPAMPKKTIRDLSPGARPVFVRVDFNVPLKAGRITDTTRIDAALPTLKDLAARGARLVVASHLGRPKGGADEPEFSLAPVAAYLKQHWPGGAVHFAQDCIGPEVETRATALKPGELLLLENLRFHPGEKKNDPEFAAALARLAGQYVDDAFGVCHRSHASVVGVPKILGGGYAGLLLEKEIHFLHGLYEQPAHPFIAVLGGAKISDKLQLMERLAHKVDAFVVGGGMAYTFLRAQGHTVGKSLVDADRLLWAATFLDQMKAGGRKIYLPVDHLGAQQTDAMFADLIETVDIPDTIAAYDIGPVTARQFRSVIETAKTVFWNGPMGIFENPVFSAGTNAVAEAMASVKGTTIVGGGDSVAAVNGAGLADKMTHISTGGGASLQLLSEGTLPGIEALSEKS
jgi:phosphoglycerate kinase